MPIRWTQAEVREIAREERTGIGLGPFSVLDPYQLAAEHGIRIYAIDELADEFHDRAARRTTRAAGSEPGKQT